MSVYTNYLQIPCVRKECRRKISVDKVRMQEAGFSIRCACGQEYVSNGKSMRKKAVDVTRTPKFRSTV